MQKEMTKNSVLHNVSCKVHAVFFFSICKGICITFLVKTDGMILKSSMRNRNVGESQDFWQIPQTN